MNGKKVVFTDGEGFCRLKVRKAFEISSNNYLITILKLINRILCDILYFIFYYLKQTRDQIAYFVYPFLLKMIKKEMSEESKQ